MWCGKGLKNFGIEIWYPILRESSQTSALPINQNDNEKWTRENQTNKQRDGEVSKQHHQQHGKERSSLFWIDDDVVDDDVSPFLTLQS